MLWIVAMPHGGVVQTRGYPYHTYKNISKVENRTTLDEDVLKTLG